MRKKAAQRFEEIGFLLQNSQRFSFFTLMSNFSINKYTLHLSSDKWLVTRTTLHRFLFLIQVAIKLYQKTGVMITPVFLIHFRNYFFNESDFFFINTSIWFKATLRKIINRF